MQKKEFEIIMLKQKSFKFGSLSYVCYDDLKNYDLITEDQDIILLYGYNVMYKTYEFHWACNDVVVLVKNLKKKHSNSLFIVSICIPFDFYLFFIKDSDDIYDIIYAECL